MSVHVFIIIITILIKHFSIVILNKPHLNKQSEFLLTNTLALLTYSENLTIIKIMSQECKNTDVFRRLQSGCHSNSHCGSLQSIQATGYTCRSINFKLSCLPAGTFIIYIYIRMLHNVTQCYIMLP